ncbi:MAG TPA: hypothetical protein VJ045_03245 [Hyphomicrobiaceae bacterium]|nr:hypothetical protein [Hyphomicrobiaceae bacterium]
MAKEFRVIANGFGQSIADIRHVAVNQADEYLRLQVEFFERAGLVPANLPSPVVKCLRQHLLFRHVARFTVERPEGLLQEKNTYAGGEELERSAITALVRYGRIPRLLWPRVRMSLSLASPSRVLVQRRVDAQA